MARRPTAIYDNELLDAHFVTGDGRGNENIGLTAVHMVFHAEHNRLVEHTKSIVLAEGDLAFLNEWLRVDVGALPVGQAAIDALQWDGERLFQAAKFGTEMQYQHLVFEEFARKIQPNIDVFLVPQGYDATINPAIVAEFAHVVYRFGHSMLTESIDRFDADFTADHIGLIQGFLNPTAFLNGGIGEDAAREAAGSIIRGMTRQVGNEIDEFVTGALRNNLLGLPLDLATINLARGRDTGVPSLNAARREFYEVTNNNSELRPYDSWVDFADGLKNPASIVNFIAAYGTHELITSQTTLEGKRDAALTIITGESVGGLLVPADADDFLNSTGGDLGHRSGYRDQHRPRQRRPLDRRPGREEHAVRRHARLDLQLRLRSPDGEAAELRPLLLPAAPRRSAPVQRDGGQLLRRDDHEEHRRHPPAVGRVLHPRPDPGSEPGAAVQRHRRGGRPATIRSAARPSIRWSIAPTTRPPAPTPTTCATPAAITSCSAAPTWATSSTRQATTS